jgi:hypothetical protein
MADYANPICNPIRSGFFTGKVLRDAIQENSSYWRGKLYADHNAVSTALDQTCAAADGLDTEEEQVLEDVLYGARVPGQVQITADDGAVDLIMHQLRLNIGESASQADPIIEPEPEPVVEHGFFIDGWHSYSDGSLNIQLSAGPDYIQFEIVGEKYYDGEIEIRPTDGELSPVTVQLRDGDQPSAVADAIRNALSGIPNAGYSFKEVPGELYQLKVYRQGAG